MTIVRRILMIAVGILLLLDLAALAVVKFSSGPSPSKEKSKLVLWIDDSAQADKAVGVLKEKSYSSLKKPAQRSTYVDADFRVVLTGPDAVLKSSERALRKSGHKNLSYNDDKTVLYYGGFYPKKAKAQEVARNLEEKERIVFEVQPGKKKVMKKSFRVIVEEMPSNMVSDATEAISEAGVEVQDQEEEPLGGEAGASAGEESEE